MAKAKDSPKNWITSTVAALCFKPGEHINPEVPGFGLRVSPKRKAVYFYRFRDKDGKLVTATIGEAAEKHVGGYALEDALQRFYREKALARGEESDGMLTLRSAFEKYLKLPRAHAKYLRHDGIRFDRAGLVGEAARFASYLRYRCGCCAERKHAHDWQAARA